MLNFWGVSSLKLTAKAPENGWLEDKPFLLGPGLFSGAFAVSLRECTLLKANQMFEYNDSPYPSRGYFKEITKTMVETLIPLLSCS